MNKPKFYYDKNFIIFFFTYQGKNHEVLKARLEVADLKELQRLRAIAEQRMAEVLKQVKEAA